MSIDAIPALLESAAESVRSVPGWRLVTTRPRLIKTIPTLLETELPAIGLQEPTGGPAWLTLDLWVQSASGGLGMFWRSNRVTDLQSRNDTLAMLLAEPESTGFVYKGEADLWAEIEDPAFSGARISDRWWPKGEAPNIAAAREDIQARLRGLSQNVESMAHALRGSAATLRAAPTTRPFVGGSRYTREQIQRLLGLEPVTGGNWFTGYHRHNNEWYLFPTVGAAGRTGHNYENRWEGGRLVWFGKTGSHVGQSTIQSMVEESAVVHLFTRDGDREPFTYHGRVKHAEVAAEVPVRIVWQLLPDTTFVEVLPEEFGSPEGYWEGAVRQVTVNAYERDPAARRACLEHWGTSCAACGLNMGERYGPLARGYVHVHHLTPIASVGSAYRVDPVTDLRPLCPNCHAVLHLKSPPLTIEELRSAMRDVAS